MPFVTFDFIPTSVSTELIFKFDSINQEPFNEQLNDIAYDSSNFVLNSGSMMLIMFYIWFQLFIIGLFSLIIRYRPNEKLKYWRDKFHAEIFWNGFMGLFLAGYIEFGMSAIMAFEKPLPSSFGRDRMSGEAFSYGLSLITVPIIFLVVPCFAVWFAFQDFNVIKFKKFKDKYGMLYTGYKYRNFTERISPYAFIWRR